MAHCTCINGHLMWNGDGKQIYLPYRLNFFKQVVKNSSDLFYKYAKEGGLKFA